MINTKEKLLFTCMATISKRPLSTVKTKNNKTTIEKTIDPLQKRLNHIRIHLLNNKKQGKVTHGEPTLVFDQFLYLGGLKSLQDKARLTRLNITHILSVIGFQPKKDLIPSKIKHLYLKAVDCISFNMAPYFEQACQFIDDARQSNGRVLVHCACGVSRSSTLCCAYLIKHHSMSIEDAITHLRSRRHIIQPNPAFLRQLIQYNEQIDSDKTTMNTILEQIENV